MNDALLTVCLTHETKAKLKGMSDALDMSMSAVVRGILNGDIPTVNQPMTYLSDRQHYKYGEAYDKYLSGVAEW